MTREDFERVWKEYPEKKGKERAWYFFKGQVKTQEDFANINKALRNYIADAINKRKSFPELRLQYGSTWFNHYWKDWVDHTPEVKKHPSGIQPAQSLDQEAMKAKIEEQYQFAKAELEAGEVRDRAWLYMVIGKYLDDYVQFGEEDMAECWKWYEKTWYELGVE